MAAPPEDESLGALVAQASHHISTLVRSEIELAKAEFTFDAKRVGTAAGLFGMAAFMLHLCLILASFAIAYGLIQMFDMWPWLAFTIVTLFYLLVASLLVFIGYRRFKGRTNMKRTARSLKNLMDVTKHDEDAALLVPATPLTRAAYQGPTAGKVGGHRASVASEKPGGAKEHPAPGHTSPRP